MEKSITYNLKLNKEQSLPFLPQLHDYRISDIIIKKDSIVFKTDDFSNQYYDYSDIAGFKPVRAEAEFKNTDSADVTVVRYYRRKQFKDRGKNGYGIRCNCYELKDFIEIWRDYDLQFHTLTAGYLAVTWILSCNNPRNKAKMVDITVPCNEITFTFYDRPIEL